MPTANVRAMPDFLLVGAQRSGTTSLYRYLREHPQVRWPALVKGPHWFDVHYTESERWYRSHFPIDIRANQVRPWRTGEACPYYLFHPAVPERIAQHLPSVRVVALLRDPVARAWSHYQHEVARGNEPLDFPGALDAEESRLAPELPHLREPGFIGEHHRHHAYVGRGLYAEQLRRYHRHLDEGRVLVLLSRQLQVDTQATYDRVCAFLGLDHHQLDIAPQHNAREYARMDPALADRLASRFAGPNQELATLIDEDPGWTS